MRNTTKYPDPVLREIATPIETVDDEVRELIDDMADVMYGDDGVGLAAPQVGVSRRLIVMDGGEGFRAVINPEIVEMNEERQTMNEGCLSLPEIRVDVSRATHVVVEGQDEQGQPIRIEADEMQARIFQHEIDHLNGVMIIDHASSVQRSLLRPKLRRLEKAAVA